MKSATRSVFEGVKEATADIARSAISDIAETLSPISLLEQILGLDEKGKRFKNRQEMEKYFADKKSTPLNPEKLQEKYQESDEAKIQQMRMRLHRQIKAQDEASWRKRQQIQRQNQLREAEEQRKKLEQEKQQDQPLIEPKGKVRRSIFAPIKRKIQQLMPEYRGNKSRG